MTKQKRHWRVSKKGHKFVAGSRIHKLVVQRDKLKDDSFNISRDAKSFKKDLDSMNNEIEKIEEGR